MSDSDQQERPTLKDRLGQALFDVEHALGMHALGFCTLPAEAIYDKALLAPYMKDIEHCHIYLIGFVPLIDFVGARQDDSKLLLDFQVHNQSYTVDFELPEGLKYRQGDDLHYLEDGAGNRFWPDMLTMQARLSAQSHAIDFDVKYIGQAYGQGGSRNALDRLLKHETLQKISLKGVPDGYRLTLLLLSIQPSNQLLTMFNPFAENKDEDGTRTKSGIDKVFNTNEQERVALFEASLIRYFYPEYNKEFKDSFPSTNLKVLKDCYDKDFSAVFAEICIDELPFRLRSETVVARNYHIAKHDLHDSEARKIFFGF